MAELDELSNEELFNSALNDEAPEAVEQIASDEGDTRARDEHGRFVAKTDDPEVKPEVTQEIKPAEQKDEAHVPSWRLKEIREERDALRQQNAELQRRFLASQPKPEPVARPDIFENPDGFVKQGVQEAVDPIKAEVNSIKEQFSLMYAVDKFGKEKVDAAYQALHEAAVSGDPEASAVAARVKASMTPFQDIVKWHDKQAVFSQIGNDPQAWFAKQLEEKLSDDKFRGELMTKLQPPSEEQPKPVFKLPPSIGKVPLARSASDEAGSMNDSSLFEHAMR